MTGPCLRPPPTPGGRSRLGGAGGSAPPGRQIVPIVASARRAGTHFGASPEGVMTTMISTLSPAGSPTRNALPAGHGNGLAAGQGQPVFPGPARVASAGLALLRRARQELAEAAAETDTAIRYNGAHLAALRAAAAIVAARGEAGTGARRRRVRPVWELLPQVEPTLAEWAAFFAAGAAKRAAAQAGLPPAAPARGGGGLLRGAATVLTVGERALGSEPEPVLPLRSAS